MQTPDEYPDDVKRLANEIASLYGILSALRRLVDRMSTEDFTGTLSCEYPKMPRAGAIEKGAARM